MRTLSAIICGTSILLAGCSESQQLSEPPSQSRELIETMQTASADAPQNEFGFWKAQESSFDLLGSDAPSARSVAMNAGANAASPERSAEQSQPSPQDLDRIAYTYGFGFQITGDAIEKLQSQHIAMCDAMGKDCRVIRSSQARTDDWDAYGSVEMQIAASKTGSLAEDLSQSAEELGGTLISSVRDGEDLSEKIIDSEARLQSRLILRDRLTEVLKTNGGSVAELVAAEKAVADVNQEIDATRSKLQEFRIRIQYSEVRLEYQPAYGESQIGFLRPVTTSLRSIGSTLGVSVAAMVYVLTALLPFLLLLFAFRWLLHRFGLRLQFWKRKNSGASLEATSLETGTATEED
ncbi:DUF4349 domain-containing protein [Erythrobacter sp. F6033]|uniref:DUF4349 domain-containing protein n=1 Tax=Erythrobacter sp. F6033 TaxID=2926401 RepID=UPI001FF55EBE|nr:DUF4349 domain-containing protein [Erythrobacter sp. F6033]MCK0128926.1 DUF4349 domain-containing protein [Erythrobacter sp. F6033]